MGIGYSTGDLRSNGDFSATAVYIGYLMTSSNLGSTGNGKEGGFETDASMGKCSQGIRSIEDNEIIGVAWKLVSTTSNATI